jgi:hypothetical protein
MGALSSKAFCIPIRPLGMLIHAGRSLLLDF